MSIRLAIPLACAILTTGTWAQQTATQASKPRSVYLTGEARVQPRGHGAQVVLRAQLVQLQILLLHAALIEHEDEQRRVVLNADDFEVFDLAGRGAWRGDYCDVLNDL